MSSYGTNLLHERKHFWSMFRLLTWLIPSKKRYNWRKFIIEIIEIFLFFLKSYRIFVLNFFFWLFKTKTLAGGVMRPRITRCFEKSIEYDVIFDHSLKVHHVNIGLMTKLVRASISKHLVILGLNMFTTLPAGSMLINNKLITL